MSLWRIGVKLILDFDVSGLLRRSSFDPKIQIFDVRSLFRKSDTNSYFLASLGLVSVLFLEVR